MPRPYTLKRRAERQSETRLRIVEAAVELHSTVGPGRASLSQIAEHAGVQRHTLYAHFPDERSLHLACSALFLERHPLPDAAAWAGIADRRARLVAGLTAVHDWYARHESLMACVLRDAEHHAITREIGEMRFGPAMGAWHDVLGDGLGSAQRAMLRLALSYFTWRTLARDAGMTAQDAVATLAGAILGAGGDRSGQ